MSRYSFTLLAVLALLSSVLVLSFDNSVAYAAPNDKPARGSKLGPHDQELLAAARAKSESTVVLLIAAAPGQNRNVANAITALGGSVRYSDDSLDYIRARVATDQVERFAALAGIQAVDLDEIIPLDDPKPEGAAPLTPQTPPDSTTPRANPYMPIQDTGAAAFMAAHPSWDGRGVTIGMVDTGVSLDHPSLLTTSTGERKVIDWVTGTDPRDDDDPTWIEMATQVSGATFTFGTPPVTYTTPAAGTYRFGIFNERDTRFGGELGRDANRDGNPAGSSGLFGILWNRTTNQVWVDIDQDLSFADQTPMTDYKVNFDVGWFGTDNPATAIREQLPFVVQTDGKNGFVNIGVVSGLHGSHTTGIAAGNALFGGQMSGAAPGAKIVSLRACLFIAGCTAHALLEGMIFVAKQSNVDVINMSIGGLPALNDGNNTRATVYNRLIEQSNVQMFISAGNSGPGLNTIGDPSVATKVMSVGAYIQRQTYIKDYGTDPVFEDNLLYFTSRGPREDGGFKPEIVAPGAAVSTTPMWQAGSGLPYTLPPGYQLQNGTSMSAPQAAGAAALLVSAAKAAGVQHQPAQLRQAINSSARYLNEPTRIQAYEQGNGLMNVNAAWNLLQTNIKTTDITSAVPVNTVLSGFLATPGVGVGIYDREGVTIGQAYTRTYTFQRTSGGGGLTTYNLSWVGNDGTFTTAGSLSLSKGGATNLTVNINPSNAGAHSAILNIDDPSTAGVDYQTLNVVIAPYVFTTPDFNQVTNSSIGRAQANHYFFRVPTGTPALKVDFSGPTAGPGTGEARFLRWHPYGIGIDNNAVSNCYPGRACSSIEGDAFSRTTTNPLAGVWEVTVDGRRTSDIATIPFSLTTSILGANVSPNPDTIASATIGTPIARSYTITNVFGAFIGRAVGTTLGSARRGVFTINNLQQQQYQVVVTAGSTSLRATIGGTSDPGADLDLFVFRCTPAPCALVGQSADGDSEESVTITNPAAGTYIVLVDGFAVPSGSTTYNYIDVFTNAAFGSVSVTDANALRPTGATWVVPGSVTANAAPAAGRVLYGNVEVRTDVNALVGSGDVIVQSVTP